MTYESMTTCFTTSEGVINAHLNEDEVVIELKTDSGQVQLIAIPRYKFAYIVEDFTSSSPLKG